MKTIVKIFLGSVICLSIVSCRSVKITNGRIPATYLSQVKLIEGVYEGRMDSQFVKLNVQLEGDYLRVTASPDILGSDCKSRIGDLKEVMVKGREPNYEVTDAYFDFDPNYCSANILGRNLAFSIKKSGATIKLSASILERMNPRRVCNPICMPNAGCIDNCHDEYTDPVYIYGDFVKH
jgi:hypothetical protein